MTSRAVKLALLVGLLLCALRASAQVVYNRETGSKRAPPMTPGQCSVVDTDGNNMSAKPCPSGGMSGMTADTGGTTSGSTVTLTGGSGVDTSRASDTITFAFDPTEITNKTWSAAGATSIVDTYSLSAGRNPVLTYGDNLTSTNTPLKVLAGNTTFTSTPIIGLNADSVITMNVVNGIYYSAKMSNQVIWDQNPYFNTSSYGLLENTQHKNVPGENRTWGITFAVGAFQNYDCDAATCTGVVLEGVTVGPNITATNSGTFSTDILQFSSVGQVQTGVTVPIRTGYRAADVQTLTGTVETNKGVIIEPLRATVAPIGLINYSSTVFLPQTTQTVVAGTAISVFTSVSPSPHLTSGTTWPLNSSGNVTFTATPTIASPPSTMDGMWIILVNVDSTDSITLKDESVMTGSNLELASGTVTLGPKQSITLMYNAGLDAWVETSRGGSGTGSGTDNHLVRWDGTTGLQDTDVVAADDGSLTHQLTSTLTSGSPSNVVLAMTADPATTTTAIYHGLSASVGTGATAASGVSNRAVEGVANCDTDTTHTCTSLLGGFFTASRNTAGAVTGATGVSALVINLSASNSITTASGISSNAPINVGTIGTYYGIYVDSTHSGTITNPWSIYSNSADPSHLNGRLESIFSSTSTVGLVGLTATVTGDHPSGTPTTRGVYGTAGSGASTATGGTYFGVDGLAACGTTNGCTALTGVRGFAARNANGAVTTAVGGAFGILNVAAGNITTGIGVSINAPTLVTGSITNAYGLYVEASAGEYDYAIITNGSDPVRFSGLTEAAGGVQTGVIDVTDSTDPSCASGEYKLWSNTSETRMKFCNQTVVASIVGGPASATDNALMRWNGTTGTLSQDNTQVTLSDNGELVQGVTSTSTSNFTTLATSLTANPASGTPIHTGATMQVNSGASSAVGLTMVAAKAQSSCDSSNGCTAGYGVNGTVLNTQTGTVTNAYGVYGSVQNLGGGAITNSYAVYSAGVVLGTAGSRWQFYANGTDPSLFKGPVIFSNPSTQSLTADSDTISCANGSYKVISATGARNPTSAPEIADGISGQICILKATGANAITLEDMTTTDTNSGIELSGDATWTADADDMLALIYDGTDWRELFRSNH
jgi:hypothetical protein